MAVFKIIARNKKASFNYFLEAKLEVGIVLKGSELKSIRAGKVNIEDAHAGLIGEELHLLNSHIAQYTLANSLATHAPNRPRKLLLHKSESRKMIGKVQQKGYTIVPLCLYFNEKNLVKLEIALGKGKQLFDKRQTIKDRELKRTKNREV